MDGYGSAVTVQQAVCRLFHFDVDDPRVLCGFNVQAVPKLSFLLQKLFLLRSYNLL